MENFSHKLRELRRNIGLTQTEMAEKMGLSLSYIHQLESEKRTPSANVKRIVQMIIDKDVVGLSAHSKNLPAVMESDAIYITKKNNGNQIPVLGWAHAGTPTNYDEIPEDWREMIYSECRDINSFAIRIIGDSMSPSYEEGDVLVLMPNEEPFSGCLAVAKFTNGDYVFRRFEFESDKVRCIAVNTRYPVTEYSRADFDWVYPVYEARRLLWRGK